MNKGDNIFVYGTLRKEEPANYMMENGAKHLGSDRISGRLYNMGWFPGVKADSLEFHEDFDPVVGDVYEIVSDDLPERLDAYEGFPNLYGRKQVVTETGKMVWVYEINSNPSEDARISSGDWKEQDNG